MIDVKPGDRVCIKGRGTDAFVHRHRRVERLTKTLIISSGGYRHRRDDGRSVPYSAYGGTCIATHCQAPKKK